MNEEITGLVWSKLTAEDSTESREIHDKLRSYIESEFGPPDRLPLVLAAKSPAGKFLGGLRGFSHWKWLYISHLFVEEEARSAGLGRELVKRAVEEAVKRACAGLYVDTFESETRDFYVRNGFKEVGQIANFPPGKTRFYLSRSLQK